ncbi:MAG: hypothetical protein K0Q73_8304 [Paenibacillus sp.]|jgi:hypothetical protein|nr:hypothetical protein [Paenibacillus sp.]
MQEGQLFTWEALSALGGASLLTYFIVQYTKGLLDRTRFKTIPTDVYAVIVAFVVLLAAQFATGASIADWRVYGLAFANAFLIAAAAGQMQNKAINPPGKR